MLRKLNRVEPMIESSVEPCVSFYENEVPAFVRPETDRIYEHLGCSLQSLNMIKKIPGASTYVARKGDDIITVLLYKRNFRSIVVLSDFIKLSQEDVALFVKNAFARFQTSWIVSFEAINTSIHRLGFPCQSSRCTEEITLSLPVSVDDYRAHLTQNMRHKINKCNNKLRNDFPSYGYAVYVQDQIREEDIRAIIELNRKRMTGKNGVSRIDEEEIRWIIKFSLQYGMVLVARINGNICGGVIGFVIGKSGFGYVLAHDQSYNSYGIGTLMVYLAICESIKKGILTFNMMSGRNPYKYQLLGVESEIVHLDVYRSRRYAFLCFKRIIKYHFKARIEQAKQWMMDAERRNDHASRLAAGIVRILRTAKRSVLHRTFQTLFNSIKNKVKAERPGAHPLDV